MMNERTQFWIIAAPVVLYMLVLTALAIAGIGRLVGWWGE